MNYEKVKSILFKSNVKISIIGIIMLFLGGLSASYPLFNADSNIIITSIFGGIFMLLVIAVLWKSTPTLIQAKTEAHPLLRAIKEEQKDYIVWLYKKQIETTLGEGAATVGTSNNVVLYTKDCNGKATELTLSKKDSADDFIEYLTNEFNIPYLGYADDTREAINNNFSNKGWKKV
jgi:hypothetical protein